MRRGGLNPQRQIVVAGIGLHKDGLDHVTRAVHQTSVSLRHTSSMTFEYPVIQSGQIEPRRCSGRRRPLRQGYCVAYRFIAHFLEL